MRSSVVAFVLIVGLAALMLTFGLGEARTRQEKEETINDLKERVAALEERLDEEEATRKSLQQKLDNLQSRLRKLESKQD